jgi:multiple sugar transport system ATP-binding protein
VFLFDEPLSNLDAKLRVQTRAEIKRLHQRVKATMIYVTHDQVEAMTLGERIVVMRTGTLQQVADPITLYERPVNQFVAGFIGSPPINFFSAQVSATGQPLAMQSNGETIALPGDLERSLGSARGKKVTVGVRPEDLTLAPGGAGGSVKAKVEVREPLGNEVLVHWSTPVGELLSRVPGQTAPAEGEAATLHFAWQKLRFFDAESEKALAAS